jgi:hypothetical protein
MKIEPLSTLIRHSINEFSAKFMETVNSNLFCAARYNRSNAIVYYQYGGLIHEAMGLETLHKVMQFAASNKVRGIVSDISTMKGTFTAVNEFFEKEY